jgi:peptidyl-prolyl cis-trans isomerase D
MLAGIRAFAKSPPAAVLLGLLVVSFAVWGVSDAFRLGISSAVIKAGDHEVGALEFKRIFDQAVTEEEQRQGRGIPKDEAVAAGLDREILRQLADDKAVSELVSRLGVKPDDKLVLAEIARTQAFIDPLTGRFSDNQYKRALANVGLTPDLFEAGLRDDIAKRHFGAGMGAGARAPRIYGVVLASYLLQTHSADYMVLNERSVPAVARPTDADLQRFMKENSAQLKQPEFRTISMVRFSAQAMAAALPLDPAAVQKQFDLERDRLSTPERRAFVQVLVKDAAAAAGAAGRMNKGESPSAVAKALGGTATPYPATSQRAIPDAQIGNAVFALQPGQTSAPVKSEFGFAVVKLLSITPAKPATLEEARPKIEEQLRTQAAQDKVYDVVQKYSDAHDSGAPLPKAAEAAGAKVYTLGPLTAQGVDRATRQKDPSLNQKMLADAFALPEGGETEIQDLGKGEYYALRVDKITPSALPDLNEVRAPLTQRYMMMELVKRLQAKAKELSDRLKSEPIDKVAASAGLQVHHIQGVSQSTAQQAAAMGQEFVGRLLQSKPGDAFVAPTGGGVAVAKAGPVTGAPIGELARTSEQGRMQINRMLMNDLSQSLAAIARARVKPKINEAKARQAIGVNEDTASSKKPAKAK